MKAAQRHARQQFVAVAEVPVRRRRTDPRPARGLGKGEAGRPFLRDQLQRGTQQCFLQIAVVVAARGFFLFLGPSHVNAIYMSPAGSSMMLERDGFPQIVIPLELCVCA